MEFIHRITNLIFKVIMEEKTEFRISSSRGGERSTKDVYAEIENGNSDFEKAKILAFQILSKLFPKASQNEWSRGPHCVIILLL